jgi:lipopolysaccharide transport system ATP-binding protein
MGFLMSYKYAIQVHNLSKHYQIYSKPINRLKQFILPGLQSVVGLNKQTYFKKFSALHDVNFAIERGDTVGVIGKNGSGKSTLLQIVCGTLNASSGSVQTHGRIAALLELGSGFNPEFTGIENIYLNAAVLGLSEEVIKQKLPSIIHFADIGDFINQPIKTYSSGMVVRLAFSVIAHVDADILIIDEALSVGDAYFTQKCMRFLRAFMQTGTVLFVSHDTTAIKNLCSQCIWLENGVIKLQGDTKEVTDEYLKNYYKNINNDLNGVNQTEFADLSKQKNLNHDKAQKQTDENKNICNEVGQIENDGIKISNKKKLQRDMRQDLLNASPFRNDIEVFAFNSQAKFFGTGNATVIDVNFQNKNGEPYNWVVGGENVALIIDIKCKKKIDRPIIGFVVKDRLGQALFGDNTYLACKDVLEALPAESTARAQFKFVMPILMPGEYAVTIAIADGTQEDHIQHQWIFDALTFRSESLNPATGLVGIPFIDISLTQIKEF